MVEIDKILSERSDEKILASVKEVSDHEFNKLVETVLGHLDLRIVRSRPKGSFIITDCFHRPDSKKYVVFFSRRDELVTKADIESLISYMERAETPNALVITTSSVVQDAIPVAEKGNIGLADGAKLAALLRRFDLDKEVMRVAEARKQKVKAIHIPGINRKLEEAMSEGYEAMSEKDYAKALDAFDRAILVDDSYDVPWRLKGNTLDEMGYHEQALECYRHALELLPESDETWFSLGSCFFALGRYDEELMCYDKALYYNPSMQKALINKGSTLHRLGRFQDALDAYDGVLKLNYRLEKVHNNRGATLHSLGKYNEALESYTRALGLKRDYVEAWMNKGNLLYELGRIDEALQAFTQMTQLRPELPRGWYLKGIASRRLGKVSQAKAAFEQAIRLDPEFAEARRALDEESKKMAEHFVEVPRIVSDIFSSEAARTYEPEPKPPTKPVELPPDVVVRVREETVEKLAEEVYGDRAELLLLLGRAEEALEYLDKSLKLEGESAHLLTSAGNVLYSQGKREAAIRSYEHALASDPAYVPAMFNLHAALLDAKEYERATAVGEALRKAPSGWQGRAVAAMDAYRRGEYKQASEDLDIALAMENLAMLNNCRGLVKLSADDFQGALESFERSLKLSLDPSEAYNNTGLVMGRKGDLERAGLELDKAIRLVKSNAAAWINRGCVLYKAERLREAVACFDESLVIAPTTVAMTNKGFCLLAMDLLPEALQAFEQSLKITETPEAYNNKGIALHRMGRGQEAQVAFNEALRMAPQFKDALSNSKLPPPPAKPPEPVPAPAPAPVAEEPKSEPSVVGSKPVQPTLSEMTDEYLAARRKVELEAICDSLGISSRGTKNDLAYKIKRARDKDKGLKL